MKVTLIADIAGQDGAYQRAFFFDKNYIEFRTKCKSSFENINQIIQLFFKKNI